MFAKATKENPALVEKIVPKCAYLENKYLDKAGVKELSAIPSKEVLIAKMLGCFQSSLSKFVGVLDQIAKAAAELMLLRIEDPDRPYETRVLRTAFHSNQSIKRKE